MTKTEFKFDMAAIDLVARNGVYSTKGGPDDRKELSNCTLRLLKAVKAGDKTGYKGLATHRNGSTK